MPWAPAPLLVGDPGEDLASGGRRPVFLPPAEGPERHQMQQRPGPRRAEHQTHKGTLTRSAGRQGLRSALGKGRCAAQRTFYFLTMSRFLKSS